MNWNRRSRKGVSSTGIGCGMWIGLLTIALTFPLLTACSTPSGFAVIDPRLTAPVERPVLQGETNRDIWRLALDQAEAIEDCADRIDAIRSLTRGN